VPPATDALEAAAAVGPYFAVTLDAPGAGWRPFADLLEPDVLRERVDGVADALASRVGVAVDRRACASTHSLALLSRLVAPALAAATLAGHVPGLAPERLRWQPVAGGPVPLAVDPDEGRAVVDAVSAAAAITDLVLTPVVEPVVAAFDRVEHVSPIVLRGNVASAAVGAATMLRRSGATLRIDPMAVAEELVSGAGRFDVPGRAFVRASCCLFYRVPNGGKCGDCVLL
jgi:hypothetical protein